MPLELNGYEKSIKLKFIPSSSQNKAESLPEDVGEFNVEHNKTLQTLIVRENSKKALVLPLNDLAKRLEAVQGVELAENGIEVVEMSYGSRKLKLIATRVRGQQFIKEERPPIIDILEGILLVK
ncbi:MAG: hypothetical protein K1X29_11295 [Bdellovibrionales bacterium]|nr:hypothetical protein [Bdellovibrionales bacterium]